MLAPVSAAVTSTPPMMAVAGIHLRRGLGSTSATPVSLVGVRNN
jgi:hypothetical protein